LPMPGSRCTSGGLPSPRAPLAHGEVTPGSDPPPGSGAALTASARGSRSRPDLRSGLRGPPRQLPRPSPAALPPPVGAASELEPPAWTAFGRVLAPRRLAAPSGHRSDTSSCRRHGAPHADSFVNPQHARCGTSSRSGKQRRAGTPAAGASFSSGARTARGGKGWSRFPLMEWVAGSSRIADVRSDSRSQDGERGVPAAGVPGGGIPLRTMPGRQEHVHETVSGRRETHPTRLPCS